MFQLHANSTLKYSVARFFSSNNLNISIQSDPNKKDFENFYKLSHLVLSWTTLNQTEHCPGQRWVRLSIVLDSAESNWAFSWTALNQTEHCPGQHWVRLNALSYHYVQIRKIVHIFGGFEIKRPVVRALCKVRRKEGGRNLSSWTNSIQHFPKSFPLTREFKAKSSLAKNIWGAMRTGPVPIVFWIFLPLA